MSELHIVIKALEELHEKGHPDYQGICASADTYAPFGITINILDECWGSWEHYSGNKNYPVPAGLDDGCPKDAFNFTDQKDAWDKEGGYGKLRYSLLQHIIDGLKDGTFVYNVWGSVRLKAVPPEDS